MVLGVVIALYESSLSVTSATREPWAVLSSVYVCPSCVMSSEGSSSTRPDTTCLLPSGAKGQGAAVTHGNLTRHQCRGENCWSLPDKGVIYFLWT